MQISKKNINIEEFSTKEEIEQLKHLLVQEQAEREAVELNQFLLETTLIEKGII